MVLKCYAFNILVIFMKKGPFIKMNLNSIVVQPKSDYSSMNWFPFVVQPGDNFRNCIHVLSCAYFFRCNNLSVNANFGPCSQEPAVWFVSLHLPPSSILITKHMACLINCKLLSFCRPLPNFGDSNCGGNIMPIAPHHSSIAHPPVTTHMQNWEAGAVVQHAFPHPPQQLHSQLGSMPFGSIQAPKLPSQPFITEVHRQSHPADSSVQNIEQHLSSQVSY